MYLRVATVSFITVSSLIFSYLMFDKNSEDTNGITDLIFLETKAINDFFLQNIDMRNAMLIFCSVLIDVITLASFYRFAVYGSSWRFIMTIIMFYSLRSITNSIFIEEKPDGYNWGFPGVMSIFVPYGTTNDFFYSGHIGICMICFLEFNACEWFKWSYLAAFTGVCQTF